MDGDIGYQHSAFSLMLCFFVEKRELEDLSEGIEASETDMEKEKQHGAGTSPRLYQYSLAGEWIVLAGKSDEDNDRLSLKLARPNDWWFHVRGMPGSHVILRHKSEEEPDRRILKSAAAIAAYHSKARDGGLVPVSCTRAQYVTKPPHAKPGTVRIRKETVLKVRPCLPE